ncbi:MAG: YicC/YloC family endoribonuclease [Polyangiaceae bacterium]
MTGFGAAEHPLSGTLSVPRTDGETKNGAGTTTGNVGVEVRAVNHRFLDVRVRVPKDLSDLAMYVEQLARAQLTRGRLEITVRVEGSALPLPSFDRHRAKSTYLALCSLRDEIAPGSEVPFAMLNAFPDLFVGAADSEMTALHEATKEAFSKAIVALDTMRAHEGKALAVDLRERLARVRELSKGVAMRAPDLVDVYRKKLRERIVRLRSAVDATLDEGRIEAEIVLFADRVDVTEELTRLESHCVQFASLLGSEEACGRRLDFLLQEMAREANTTGAKSPDAQVAHAVVEMKAELERMREQVQNVE